MNPFLQILQHQQNIMNTSAALAGRAARYPQYVASSLASTPTTRIGFTPPIAIYDRMDETNASALQLNNLVIKLAQSDSAFRASWPQTSWNMWLADWKRFYDKYFYWQGKLSAAFHSDEVNKQAEDKHSQLQSFYDTYNKQKLENGKAVPQVAPPTYRGDEGKDKRGGGTLDLPWWVWLAGGVVVTGSGYYAYRRYYKK